MSSKEFNYIIVGAGLAGGIIARKIAESGGRRVLIVERRHHIAGNMYDYDNEAGIKVQRYGPHTFHTNNDEVYEMLMRFCVPNPYRTRCEAVIDGVSTPSPFNFRTIDQFYGKQEAQALKAILLDYYNSREEVTVLEMLEAEEPEIRRYAQFLFDKDYRLYTAKQWNLPPNQIDSSVLKRVPIVLSYRDTYFDDKYEFLPEDGFTEFYRRLIDHPNIAVELGCDALKHIEADEERNVLLYDGHTVNIVYTGAIDELFRYRFGILPYRSLRFEFKILDICSFQNVAIVAYPQAEGYTRITEYTKMPVQDAGEKTCLAYEYPQMYSKGTNEPYYPVLTEQSKETYAEYRSYASKFRNLTLCGRLADFKYYNMDQVVARALEVYGQMEAGI